MTAEPTPGRSIEPAEWFTVILSWLVFLAGLAFYPALCGTWLAAGLGALPVLITSWWLGKAYGAVSAGLIAVLDLAVAGWLLNRTALSQGAWIGNLILFAALAVLGIFVGHLRDMQRAARAELQSIEKNNQKLAHLARTLETTSRLTNELLTAADWIEILPRHLQEIGSTSGLDHLFLFQLTGNGSERYLGYTSHYWADPPLTKPPDYPAPIPDEMLAWVDDSISGQPVTGSLPELSPELREVLGLRDRGFFAVFPVSASGSLWGYLGLESDSESGQISPQDLDLFHKIAHALGAIIYQKLIEDHLDLRARELDSLQKASSNLAVSDQLESGLQAVLTQIYELTPASDASIYLLQNQQPTHFISLTANSQQSLPYALPGEQTLAALVAEHQQDYFINNLAKFEAVPRDPNIPQRAVICFALRAAAEIVGTLTIWYQEVRSFSEQERTILRLLADQAASAIINMQYLQAEREQRQLADSLRKANLQLSDNLELKSVLESILNQVLLLVNARDAEVFLYDGQKLEFGAVRYAEGVKPEPVHPIQPDSPFYRCVETGQRILIADIQGEPSLKENWISGSLVILPLIFQYQAIGVMNVTFFEPGELGESLLQVLDLLSNQAAIAINNARTYEAERKQRRLAQALQYTGRAIQSSLDLEVVLDQILTQISSVIPYDGANLILVENGEARIVRQEGFQDTSAPRPQPDSEAFDISRYKTLKQMAASRKPLIIPDIERSPDWIKTESTAKVLSWAGAPILVGDEVIGYLSLNNHTRNYYTQEHAQILSAFASQASIALRHARLHQEIQDLAVTDPLTGIFNRRGLERWGQYEIDRALRFGSPLAAIFFDLDYFKDINDSYGHDTGDEILKQVVRSITGVIRKIDIFARIGGEEFLIILPETSLGTAVQVAERIRLTIAGRKFEINSHSLRITLSLGAVELNREVEGLADLINQADQYMYQAKGAGRNQTAHPQG